MGQQHKKRGGRVIRWASALVAVLMVGSVSYIGLKYFDFSKAATSGTLYISPASGTYATGSTVAFTVREASGATPVNGVQFDLNYNSSQLQYLGNTNGDFLAASQTNTATPGLVRVFRGAATALTGDRAVVSLNFKMLAASGTTPLSFVQAKSFITNASTSSNALQAVQGSTFTVAGSSTSVTQNASLSLSPSSGTVAPGGTLTVTVRLNSPAQRAFVVQPVVSYPSNLLQFQSAQNSTAFPSASRSDTATAGSLDFIRGIAGGSKGFIGQADVIKLTFKATAGSGTANIAFKRIGTGSIASVLDGSGKNLLGTTTDASFAIGSTVTPPPAPAPNPSSNPIPTPTPSPVSGTAPSLAPAAARPSATPITTANNVTFTPKPSTGATVALSNEGPVVQGTVGLTQVADPEVLAENPGDVIVKVEYLIGGKSVSTKTAPPYGYDLDSTQYKNGKYQMTIRTTYGNGDVDLTKEAIVVNNKVTLVYILQHYMLHILIGVGSLAIISVVGLKYVLPHFGGGNDYDYGDGYDGYAKGGAGGEPPAPQVGGGGYINSFASSYNVADPLVVTPANAPPPTPVVPAEQVAAAQLTQPIDSASMQYAQPGGQPVPQSVPVPSQPFAAAEAAAGPQPPAPAAAPSAVLAPYPAETPVATQPIAPVQNAQPVQAPVPAQPAGPASPQPAYDPYGRPIAGGGHTSVPTSGQVVQPGSEGEPPVKYDRKYF